MNWKMRLRELLGQKNVSDTKTFDIYELTKIIMFYED